MKELNVDGLMVALDRRDVKNINLYVKPPDGQILVTAPRRASEKRILEFIRSRKDWIQKARERVIGRAEETGEFKEDPITKEQAENLKTAIGDYAAKWEPVMGVHAVKWQIRDMKTRWGSCSVNTAHIRINLRLAAKPPECLEYVIVHELCHLLEPSHNARFHSLMDQFLPDWRERRLRLNGRK